jgi:hypothetical protein
MSYLAIFIHHGDDTATWSEHVDTLDKEAIVKQLSHGPGYTSLDWAEILVIGNESCTEQCHSALMVFRHWTARNGDFEGI